MDLISILIPCYNNEAYVGAAIESALNQTWPACEIILVDDGSTDDSLAITRQYKDDGVQVIAQSNKGAPAARNRALAAATGNFVQYLDADDLLHPYKVEAQVRALQDAPPRTVAVCPTCYFYDGTEPEQGRLELGSETLNSDNTAQWLIDLWTPGKGWGMVQPGAYLSPRSVIEEAGLWKEYVSPDDDGEYFTRVLLAGNGLRYVDEGCVYYRHYEHSGRVSALRSREALEGWLRSIDAKRDQVLPLTTPTNRADARLGIARQYWSLAISAYLAHPKVADIAETRAGKLGFSKPLHRVSSNSWKGWVAGIVRSAFGWRAARKLQQVYHQMRETIDEVL